MTTYGRIQFRRDSAADWSSINPILLKGELGFEETTGLFKWGNGTSPWNALPYFGSGNAFSALLVWDAIQSMPPFVGAGDTAALARQEIGAISIADAEQLIANLIDGAPEHANTLRELYESLQAADVDGIMSAIAALQTDKQPADADLTAIAALTTTAFGRGLLALADKPALRAYADLVPGTNVLAYNADLAALAIMLAAATGTADKMVTYNPNTDTWNSFNTYTFGRSVVGQASASDLNNLLVAARTDANTGATVSYTAALANAQNLITTNNAAANKVLIPTHATQAFPLWSVITVLTLGAGQTTFEAVTPGTTTLRVPNGAKSSAQHTYMSAQKIANDEWVIFGSTVV